MGTPCAIGMKLADASVRAIRCNYDGYVAGAGVILAGWYTEPTKIGHCPQYFTIRGDEPSA